jgi:hypothetical protein
MSHHARVVAAARAGDCGRAHAHARAGSGHAIGTTATEQPARWINASDTVAIVAPAGCRRAATTTNWAVRAPPRGQPVRRCRAATRSARVRPDTSPTSASPRRQACARPRYASLPTTCVAPVPVRLWHRDHVYRWLGWSVSVHSRSGRSLSWLPAKCASSVTNRSRPRGGAHGTYRLVESLLIGGTGGLCREHSARPPRRSRLRSPAIESCGARGCTCKTIYIDTDARRRRFDRVPDRKFRRSSIGAH